MPERPDLEYVVPILDREVAGKAITAVRADNPVVLRVALREPVTAVVGHTIASVRRRAHFVVFALAGDPPLTLVDRAHARGALHPRRAGGSPPGGSRLHPGARRRPRAALPGRRADGQGLPPRRRAGGAGARLRLGRRRRARPQGLHPQSLPGAGEDAPGSGQGLPHGQERARRHGQRLRGRGALRGAPAPQDLRPQPHGGRGRPPPRRHRPRPRRGPRGGGAPRSRRSTRRCATSSACGTGTASRAPAAAPPSARPGSTGTTRSTARSASRTAGPAPSSTSGG